MRTANGAVRWRDVHDMTEGRAARLSRACTARLKCWSWRKEGGSLSAPSSPRPGRVQQLKAVADWWEALRSIDCQPNGLRRLPTGSILHELRRQYRPAHPAHRPTGRTYRLHDDRRGSGGGTSLGMAGRERRDFRSGWHLRRRLWARGRVWLFDLGGYW